MFFHFESLHNQRRVHGERVDKNFSKEIPHLIAINDKANAIMVKSRKFFPYVIPKSIGHGHIIPPAHMYAYALGYLGDLFRKGAEEMDNGTNPIALTTCVYRYMRDKRNSGITQIKDIVPELAKHKPKDMQSKAACPA